VTSRLDPALEMAAAVPFAMAVLIVAIGLLRLPAAGRAAPEELAAALALGLELLLAAGLLRLAVIDDFLSLAVVAAVVVLRKLVSTGIRLAVRAVGSSFRRPVR
jgi:uncharacterized membrane protein